MCVCVCVYIYIYIGMYLCIYVRIYVWRLITEEDYYLFTNILFFCLERYKCLCARKITPACVRMYMRSWSFHAWVMLSNLCVCVFDTECVQEHMLSTICNTEKHLQAYIYPYIPTDGLHTCAYKYVVHKHTRTSTHSTQAPHIYNCVSSQNKYTTRWHVYGTCSRMFMFFLPTKVKISIMYTCVQAHVHCPDVRKHNNIFA